MLAASARRLRVRAYTRVYRSQSPHLGFLKCGTRLRPIHCLWLACSWFVQIAQQKPRFRSISREQPQNLRLPYIYMQPRGSCTLCRNRRHCLVFAGEARPLLVSSDFHHRSCVCSVGEMVPFTSVRMSAATPSEAVRISYEGLKGSSSIWLCKVVRSMAALLCPRLGRS
ncbi:hypothetical protein IQ06DRAFT_92333 [Phaeosphaeriaceae sp. SRC1lsM3a]|nr:hypothetical protein IQ06DRAFT_92333 [Stagonospora sp. SRC1lsM3a]